LRGENEERNTLLATCSWTSTLLAAQGYARDVAGG